MHECAINKLIGTKDVMYVICYEGKPFDPKDFGKSKGLYCYTTLSAAKRTMSNLPSVFCAFHHIDIEPSKLSIVEYVPKGDE